MTSCAHTASHAHTLEHACGVGCATDGTGLAVVLVLTVRCANTLEAVTLHNTCEALTLGLANDVDLLACFEELNGQFLTEGILRSICGTQLDNVTTGGNTGLLEVTSQGLGNLARVDCTETNLNSLVAVSLLVTDLGNNVRISLDDGDGHKLAVLVPDLGHTELGAQQALHLALEFVSH